MCVPENQQDRANEYNVSSDGTRPPSSEENELVEKNKIASLNVEQF